MRATSIPPAGNEWYYQYLRETQRRGVTADLCPTWEYVFRAVRGVWWTVESTIENGWPILNPKNKFTRTLCDKELIRLAQVCGCALNHSRWLFKWQGLFRFVMGVNPL